MSREERDHVDWILKEATRPSTGRASPRLLPCAAWLLRWVRVQPEFQMPPEVEAAARTVGQKLIEMDMAFGAADIRHMEEFLGRSRPRYWRQNAARRRVRDVQGLYREVRKLRDRGVPAMEAFEVAAGKYHVSMSLAQKWYYEQESLVRALPASSRAAYVSAVATRSSRTGPKRSR